MTRLPKVALVVAAVLVATACGGSAAADTAKPKGWQVVHYGDHGKLATFCDHGNRIYVTQDASYDRLAVAANDPTCVEVPK